MCETALSSPPKKNCNIAIPFSHPPNYEYNTEIYIYIRNIDIKRDCFNLCACVLCIHHTKHRDGGCNRISASVRAL